MRTTHYFWNEHYLHSSLVWVARVSDLRGQIRDRVWSSNSRLRVARKFYHSQSFTWTLLVSISTTVWPKSTHKYAYVEQRKQVARPTDHEHDHVPDKHCRTKCHGREGALGQNDPSKTTLHAHTELHKLFDDHLCQRTTCAEPRPCGTFPQQSCTRILYFTGILTSVYNRGSSALHAKKQQHTRPHKISQPCSRGSQLLDDHLRQTISMRNFTITKLRSNNILHAESISQTSHEVPEKYTSK